MALGGWHKDGGRELEIDVEPDLEGRVVLHLRGVLDLPEVGDLRPVLTEACALDGPDLVVDLRELSFISSSGMGALVRAHKDLDQRGRHLVIRGAPPRIRRAFAITHLDRVLQMEDA